MQDVPFTVVLPVKLLAAAKSRLGAPSAVRADLALGMARDVVTAARAVARGLFGSDEPRAAGLGADLLEPDVPAAGLSAALAHGAAVAAGRWPGDGVVALAADLPCLTSTALRAVLDRAGAGGVVADASGVGTVLLAAPPGSALRPAYEGASFAAHRAQGAADLTPYAADVLRRDVDTVADLAGAVRLGVGPATLDALTRHADDWAEVVHLGLPGSSA